MAAVAPLLAALCVAAASSVDAASSRLAADTADTEPPPQPHHLSGSESQQRARWMASAAAVPFLPCHCSEPSRAASNRHAARLSRAELLACALADDGSEAGARSLAPRQLGAEGLRTVRDYLNASQQREIFEQLQANTWFEYDGKSCQEYGQPFSFYGRKRSTATAMPPAVASLARMLVRDGILAPHEAPDYVLVNKYAPGQGIHAHVDDSYYADGIVSVTLLAGGVLRFYRDRSSPYYKSNISNISNTARGHAVPGHPEYWRHKHERLLLGKYWQPRPELLDLHSCGAGSFQAGSLFAMHGESRWAYVHDMPARQSDRL